MISEHLYAWSSTCLLRWSPLQTFKHVSSNIFNTMFRDLTLSQNLWRASKAKHSLILPSPCFFPFHLGKFQLHSQILPRVIFKIVFCLLLQNSCSFFFFSPKTYPWATTCLRISEVSCPVPTTSEVCHLVSVHTADTTTSTPYGASIKKIQLRPSQAGKMSTESQKQ